MLAELIHSSPPASSLARLVYIYIYKSNQTTNSSHYLYLCKHAFWRTWNDGLFLHILYEGCPSQQVSWRQTLQSDHLSETTAWFTDSCLESFAEMSPVQLNMQRKRGVCHVIEKQVKQIHWCHVRSIRKSKFFCSTPSAILNPNTASPKHNLSLLQQATR